MTYKGFALFNDIEDFNLRTCNRAVVLTNIFQDNSRFNKVSPKGTALIVGYFDKITPCERDAVTKAFVINMKDRGYKLD